MASSYLDCFCLNCDILVLIGMGFDGDRLFLISVSGVCKSYPVSIMVVLNFLVGLENEVIFFGGSYIFVSTMLL